METIQRTDSPRDLTPEEVTARMRVLFQTMADFYRAAPWRCAELASHFVEVTIPDLGVREAVVLLTGDDELPPGLCLFESIQEVGRLDRETEAHRRKMQATCPPVVTLTFQPPPNESEAARVQRDGLDLAALDAFPVVNRLEQDFQPGPPDVLDVIAVSAIAVAMAGFTPEPEPWQRGEPVVRTARIHLGEVAVSLRNADVPPRVVQTNILARLGDTDDSFERIALEEELLRQFAREHSRMPAWFPLAPRAMLDLLFHDHRVTIVSVGEHAFRQTLFESIAEANVIDASQAAPFIFALEAFLQFMKRSHGLPQADELLRVVGPGATERLEARVRAVSPGWVPQFAHPVDMAPPRVRKDRATRRARARGSSSKRR
jgi:hypothetical protein